MEVERLPALALARLYDLAAALYLQEPDQALLERIAPVLPADWGGEELAGSDLSTLRQEYHDLFCVPVSGRYLPPFESAQREGRLLGAASRHAAGLYQAAGFHLENLEICPLWQSNPIPDHIGFELAFASFLLSSLQAGEKPTGQTILEHFWQQHLARWAPQYGQKLAQQAALPLYRLLGELTSRLF